MASVVVSLEALLSPVESSTLASDSQVVVEPLLLAHASAGEAVIPLSVSLCSGGVGSAYLFVC